MNKQLKRKQVLQRANLEIPARHGAVPLGATQYVHSICVREIKDSGNKPGPGKRRKKKSEKDEFIQFREYTKQSPSTLYLLSLLECIFLLSPFGLGGNCPPSTTNFASCHCHAVHILPPHHPSWTAYSVLYLV